MKWIDRYFRRTRSPVAELTRHFFNGLLRPESVAGEDSFLSWLVQIIAVLIAISWYFPVQLFRRYLELHALDEPQRFRLAYSSDCLMMLLLMTLAVGLLTVIEWSALFPSRRDHLVLMPLPITRLQLFSAKLAALSLFVTLFILAITVLASLALPIVASGRWETRPVLLRAVALLVASVGSTCFVFLSLVALQGVMMALLPVRLFDSISFVAQVILLIGCLCGLALFFFFPSRQLVATQSPVLEWIPPAWFWAVAERVIGTDTTMVNSLATRAFMSLMAAFALAVTSYLVSYLRYGRLSLESVRRDRAPKLVLTGLFVRSFHLPQARAVASFVAITMLRGRQQKLVFWLILSLGVALAFQSVILNLYRRGPMSARWDGLVVGLPMILSFFAMIALRRVFRIPAELPANWIFRFLEDPHARPKQLDAVFRMFLLFGGLPMLMIFLPVQIVVLGWHAVRIFPAQILTMAVLAEYLLNHWQSIPFTFPHNPARLHFVQSASLHITELFFYTGISSALMQATMRKPDGIAWYIGVLGIIWLWLHRRRRCAWGTEPFEFSEGELRAVEPLRISPE